MIHQYKCSNYMAKQILTDVAPYEMQHKFGYASCESGGKINFIACHLIHFI